MFELLLPMLRAWQQSNLRGDTQREAMIAVTEIAHTVRVSAIESISIQTNTWSDPGSGQTREADAITMLSPVDHQTGMIDFAARDAATADEISLVWHQFVVYYLNTRDNTLRVGEVAITPAEQPSPNTLNFSSYTPSSTDRVLAHHVCALQLKATGAVTTVTPPTLAGAIQIQLQMNNQGYVYSEQTSATPLHPL
ncbi:MAG: hypothetical protein ACYCW6_17500 [Candidatus Xenobia bacterium]